jgi:hypothetical protein
MLLAIGILMFIAGSWMGFLAIFHMDAGGAQALAFHLWAAVAIIGFVLSVMILFPPDGHGGDCSPEWTGRGGYASTC